MLRRVATVLAAAILYLAPTPGRADLSGYVQNFEGLVKSDTGALAAAGWLVFGNVSSPIGTYLYGYGPFPAPNDGAAFCAIDSAQGGLSQGAHQLSVYSDYNNVAEHTAGNLVEANVFREWTVGAANVGSTWTFEFDAKRGLLAGATTAIAFIKTLDPGAGYALTNFLTLDMTTISTTWERYSISIVIDAGLAGQILQIGFANTATNFEPSGVFYDNILFADAALTSAETIGGPQRPTLVASVAPNPLNPAGMLSFRTSRSGPVAVRMFDVNGRLVRTLLERQVLPSGSHSVSIDGRGQHGEPLSSGVYFYRVETSEGIVRGKLSIAK